MSSKSRVHLICHIMLLLILTSCGSNPPQVSVDEVATQVQDYFIHSYGLDVVVTNVAYVQVGANDYVNEVTVSNEESEYKLVFDKNNKPYSDNVSELRTINSIDVSLLENEIIAQGLRLPDVSDKYLVTSKQNLQYKIWFPVFAEGRLNNGSEEGMYSLLGILKNVGIDLFSIDINSPVFLLPKPEFGQGTRGLNIAGVVLETDMGRNGFNAKYNELVNKVYWDEQKFNDKITELTDAGYQNVNFFIARWADGNTLEIILYCESDISLTEELAVAITDEMDDSYFRITDVEVKYTVRHEKYR